MIMMLSTVFKLSLLRTKNHFFVEKVNLWFVKNVCFYIYIGKRKTIFGIISKGLLHDGHCNTYNCVVAILIPKLIWISFCTQADLDKLLYPS